MGVGACVGGREGSRRRVLGEGRHRRGECWGRGVVAGEQVRGRNVGGSFKGRFSRIDVIG